MNNFTSYSDWRARRLDDNAPNITEQQAYDFLIEACIQDHPDSIIQIYEEYPIWISSDLVPDDERHRIVKAIELHRPRCLQAFLSWSDCERWTLSAGRTLLHFAVDFKADWAVRQLLQTEIEVDAIDASGLSAGEWAYLSGDDALQTAFNQSDYADRFEKPLPECLSMAITEQFKYLLTHFVPKDHLQRSAFLKEKCAQLQKHGFDPDAKPSLVSLLFSTAFTRDRDASHHVKQLQETTEFCLGMGADWRKSSPHGSMDGVDKPLLNALELSIATLNRPVFETLLQSGVAVTDIADNPAVIAWRCILSAESYSPPLNFLANTGSTFSKALPLADYSRLGFLMHLSQTYNYWPPFAQTPEIAFDFLKELSMKNKDRSSRMLACLEMLELDVISGCSQANRAIRVTRKV